MDMQIEERVANGAAWLDERYPTWWHAIDLGVLDVESCVSCVLGQVYSGVVPDDEKDGIVAQVLKGLSLFERKTFQQAYLTGEVAGFHVMHEYHDLLAKAPGLGFSVNWGSPGLGIEEYQALTDEWTRVIISRRMARQLVAV